MRCLKLIVLVASILDCYDGHMNTPKQSDRLTPLQAPYNNLYLQKTPTLEEAVLAFCSQSVSDLPTVTATSDKFPIEVMASPPLQANFLQMLIRLSDTTSILEIGTFIGLTTLAFAQALGENGHVTTIEKGDEFGAIARTNFNSNPLGKKISSHVGDAFKIIPSLPKDLTFDFVFLDGAKEIYWEIFTVARDRMKSGAVLVADDVFCQGDALQTTPQTEKGTGTKRFVENMVKETGWTSTVVPIFNGLLIAKKL